MPANGRCALRVPRWRPKKGWNLAADSTFVFTLRVAEMPARSRYLKIEEEIMAKAKRAVPEGLHTVTPMLTLDNASQALAWYVKALGAEEISRAAGPDGKIVHAQIRIGNSQIMMHNAMMDAKAPHAMGGSPISLWIYVR